MASVSRSTVASLLRLRTWGTTAPLAEVVAARTTTEKIRVGAGPGRTRS